MIRTSITPNPKHRGLTLVPSSGHSQGRRKAPSDLDIVAHWVSQSLKILNPIHAVHLSRPGAQGLRPVTGPADGALRRARPAACRECHQRGSELLRTPGLYPDYRRLLLEDLAVLRRGEVEG